MAFEPLSRWIAEEVDHSCSDTARDVEQPWITADGIEKPSAQDEFWVIAAAAPLPKVNSPEMFGAFDARA